MRRLCPLVLMVLAAAAHASAAPPAPESFALTGHKGAVIFAGFSADTKVLTTVDEHGLVQRWDARTGKLLSSRSDGPLPLEHPREDLRKDWGSGPARAFTPDGSAVARLTKKGTALVRDLSTGKERVFRPDDGWDFCGVAISTDGKVLATAAAKAKGEGYQISFWDVTTGKILRTCDEPKPVHGMPVTVPIQMEFAPGGKTLVTTEVAIRCWDVATGRYRAHLASVFGWQISFSPDGKRVAVGSVAPSIEGVGYYTNVIDTVTAEHVTGLGVRVQRTRAGWFLSGGRLVAAQGLPDDGKPSGAFVQLQEIGAWKPTVRLDGWFAAASPDGKVVLTLAPDKKQPGRVLTAWDATTGAELGRLPRDWVPWEYTVLPSGFLPGVSVRFSPDSTRLAVTESWGGTSDQPRMGVRLIPTAGLWTAPSPDTPPTAPAPRLVGEAERLLREMDAKIASAKTLRIDYELRLPAGLIRELRGNESQASTTVGSLLLCGRNRFRNEGASDGRLWISVSDGKQYGNVHSDFRSPVVRPLPDWDQVVLRSWLSRGGPTVAVFEIITGLTPGRVITGPKTSNARRLPDEVLNGVRCRVIGYDLAWLGNKNPVRVWIDPTTALPVQRELTFLGSTLKTCTAVYTRFVLDPKLDDRMFQLPSEADLLLIQMDAKIRQARTLRVEFEVRDASVAKGEPVAKGALLLADGNRFRHELNTFWLLQKHALTVSDGKRIGGRRPNTNDPPLPEWHTEVLKSWLGRGGTFLPPAMVLSHAGTAGGKKPGPDDAPQVAHARLLPDEEVGGVKAKVVAYRSTWRARGDDPLDEVQQVRVWIDPKTNLPLRRTFTTCKWFRESTYTETITKFEIDPQLDDKLFELPK